jgi:hypothetical protein
LLANAPVIGARNKFAGRGDNIEITTWRYHMRPVGFPPPSPRRIEDPGPTKPVIPHTPAQQQGPAQVDPSQKPPLVDLGGTVVDARHVATVHPQWLWASPTESGATVVHMPKNAVFTVPAQPDPGRDGWLYVTTTAPNGKQLFGWVKESDIKDVTAEEAQALQSATTPLVSPAGYPDGSAHDAIAWLEKQMTTPDKGAKYNDMCLGSVLSAYAIYAVAHRCPELSWANGTNNAIGAYTDIKNNYKLMPADGAPDLHAPLPEGAIVFFDKTAKNHNDGHICIATGRMAADGTPEVITSGWPSNPGFHYSSVGELDKVSGPYLGYTTPEIAFPPGSYPK